MKIFFVKDVDSSIVSVHRTEAGAEAKCAILEAAPSVWYHGCWTDDAEVEE